MEISELAKKNPWWQANYTMDADKHIADLTRSKIIWEPALLDKLEEGVYTLRGPRQVGKTTWIKMQIKRLLQTEKKEDMCYYACDLMRNNKEIIDLIESYLSWNHEGRYIFLDEITYVENWQLAIKHLVDAGTLSGKTLLVTGSHSLDMKRNIEQLPGRLGRGKRHFIFFPMCFSRFVKLVNPSLANEIYQNDFTKSIKKCEMYINELNSLLKIYCITGGFPKVINEYFQNKNIDDDIYDLYVSWIKGEIGKWKKDENKSIQIIRKIINSYVSPINWNTIKNATDLESHHTVSSYVEMFEKMFLLEFIYSFDSSSLIPVFRKNKKIYFVDPFIYAAMEKWSFGITNIFEKMNLIEDVVFSKIVEGIVLNYLIAAETKNSQSNVFEYKNNIAYLKTKTGKEIDFVICRNNLIGYLEVKWQIQTNLPRNFEGLLLTRNDFDINTRRIPVSVFLALEDSYDLFLFGERLATDKK